MGHAKGLISYVKSSSINIVKQYPALSLKTKGWFVKPKSRGAFSFVCKHLYDKFDHPQGTLSHGLQRNFSFPHTLCIRWALFLKCYTPHAKLMYLYLHIIPDVCIFYLYIKYFMVNTVIQQIGREGGSFRYGLSTFRYLE